MTVGTVRWWQVGPPPDSPEWTVPIDMPRFGMTAGTGKYGKLVGWLTTNNTASAVRGRIGQDQAAAAWRAAAAAAYERHQVPRGIGPVFVVLEYAKAAGRKFDSPNLEPTVKPVIDALQPPRVGVKTLSNRYGITAPVEYPIPGWGVVPEDSDRWVIRGPQMPWLPNVPADVGGRIVVTIIPYPRPST